MKNSNNRKANIWHILLMFSLMSLIVLGGYKAVQQGVADREKAGISQVDTIISYIQRAAKLELEVSDNKELLLELDEMMSGILSIEGESLYFTDDSEVFGLVQELQDGYHSFVNAIYNFRVDADRDQLFNASENNYTISTGINKKLSLHLDALLVDVTKISKAITWNVCISMAILGIILLNIMKELKYNKELTEKVYIDISTGLYNRAKCQEVLKTPVDPTNPKDRAIIIFDLNDLKKTNDQLGHRAGDDLIASFGVQLKEATRISSAEIFVGRYGGDEFMAYLGSVSELDVKRYLEEVQFCIDEFNRTGGREFQLSCAAGYCITTKETSGMTMSDLFDRADTDMYENKMEMKRKKKEELLKQGIVLEEIVDDRLA